MLSFPIKPMLLQPRSTPFDSSDYLFELKVDGIRCIKHFNQGEVRLQSKSGKDFTRAFPEIHVPPIRSGEAVFDGEVTVLTDGKPDFESTMERLLARESLIERLMKKKPAIYFIWDILWHNGKRLMDLPLIERKTLLDHSVENSETQKKIDWLDTDGLALWDAVLKQGLEGIVAKRKDSRYLSGKRSNKWLKIKNYTEAIVNLLGYSSKDGTVLVGLGSNVQGHALGINNIDRIVLKQLLDQFGQGGKGSVTWLPVGVKARVKFTTLTPRGNMRDCSWIGFEI